MKKYFYSGNTPIRNGSNTQVWGIIEADDDADPYEVAFKISIDKAKEFNASSFSLTSFNIIE